MSNLHLVGLQKGEQEQEKLRLNLYTDNTKMHLYQNKLKTLKKVSKNGCRERKNSSWSDEFVESVVCYGSLVLKDNRTAVSSSTMNSLVYSIVF